MNRLVAVALALVTLCACSDPLEFSDWVIPVPEAVPVHEYAGVPLSERTEQIEVVRDLEIGERAGNDNYSLYNAGPVIAGPGGELYVLDRGNWRIQVFDAEGDYSRTMGRQGQGPGEFERPNGMLIAGDQLLAADFGARRYTIWSLDGEYLREVKYPAGPRPLSLTGFADGTMIGVLRVRDEGVDGFESSRRPHFRLNVYDFTAGIVNEVQDFPVQVLPAIVRTTETGGSFLRMRVPAASMTFAATRGGAVFTTMGEEYQIHALNKDGTMEWALRVAGDRVPIREEEILEALEAARERRPDASRSEVDWPSHRPTISRLQVDGHGNVFAFLYPEDDEEREDVAVDVYSPEGDRLFTGFMPNIRWTDAAGDFLYSRESDDVTGEERILRYRLEAPWSRN